MPSTLADLDRQRFEQQRAKTPSNNNAPVYQSPLANVAPPRRPVRIVKFRDVRSIKSDSPDREKPGFQLLCEMRDRLQAICSDATKFFSRIEDEVMIEAAKMICRGLIQAQEIINDFGLEEYESFPVREMDASPFGNGLAWFEEVDDDQEQEDDEDEEEID